MRVVSPFLVAGACVFLTLGACDSPGVDNAGQVDASSDTSAVGPDTSSEDGGPAPDAGGEPDAPDPGGDEGPAPPDTFVLPDIDPNTPDVGIQKQPLAGVCTEDDDCIDGWCNVQYPGGYCSAPCAGDEDCPAGGKCFADPKGGGKMCWKACQLDEECRLDQFCPSGADICTPKCQDDTDCNPGYVCNAESGQCQQMAPEPCEPEDEVCDGADNDCDNIVDEGCGPELGESEGHLIDDLGVVKVGGGGLSKSLSFKLSNAASSFTILVLSTDGSESILAVWELTSPSGVLLHNASDAWDSPIRAIPSLGVVAVQVPNTPEVGLESGTYKFTIFREGDVGEAHVYVVQNLRQQTSSSKIDLNFWFVGLGQLNSASAPGSNKFQYLVDILSQLLDAHGIQIGKIEYFDVTGADANKYTMVDNSEDGTLDEHAELLALSGSLPPDNKGVNFFFVQGFNGWSTLGRAGGIPGPPLLHGTWGSGVVVSMVDYFYYATEWGVPATVQTMAHELGHQLGLFHSSERDGTMHDPLPDTPECTNDADGDGFVAPWECEGKGAENMMFWTGDYNGSLSAGQKFVIHRNPQVVEP